MSELTSNFRIKSFLFELGTFGTNYGLQTADRVIVRCPKVALRHFGPFPAKRLLKMVDTWVFFRANLTLQNTPGAIVQRFGIWRFWWPLWWRKSSFWLIFMPVIIFVALKPQYLIPNRSSSPTTDFNMDSRLEYFSLNRFATQNRISDINLASKTAKFWYFGTIVLRKARMTYETYQTIVRGLKSSHRLSVKKIQ